MFARLKAEWRLKLVLLDWLVIAGWFGFGKKSGSTETMGALLQRKKEAQAAIAPAERPRPVTILPKSMASALSATATTPTTAAQKPQPKTDEASTTDEQQSTTERLLARRRKRQDGDK